MYVDRAARCPVVHTGDNEATLLKMADILYVNKHRGVLQAADLLGSNRPAIPLSLDGPEHTKYRRLLDPVFTARRIAPLADSVRMLANELIDRFVDRGEADVYREWCEPLPGTVFIRILGLPLDDLPNFLRFKNMVLGNEFASLPFDEAMARRDEAVEWIQQYFNRNLDERMAGTDPGDDLLGWLLTTEVDGERLTREDILDILGLLMIAGLDTVAASLACMLSYFARHPEQRARGGRRPVAVAVGRRGAHAVRVAGDRRRAHRHRRSRTAERRAHLRGHAHVGDLGGGQRRPRLLSRPAHGRPPPVAQRAHRLRERLPPLPRFAPRPDGDARGARGLAPANSRLRDRARGGRSCTRGTRVRPTTSRSCGPEDAHGIRSLIPHTGRSASRRNTCARTAPTAEEAGFDSLWAVDHMVMPQHTDSKYTLGRQPAVDR